MSREVHVRFCERLGHLSPADSTADRDPAEFIGVESSAVSEGKKLAQVVE